jgi:threonine dehydrogenase-like Zn-dependent dehydrogenase
MKVLYKDKQGVTTIVEKDKPSVVHANDVLIKVVYGAICRTDTYVYNGRIPTNDISLGHEIAGLVVDKGSSVTRLNIGDKVSVNPFKGCGHCDYCADKNYQLCSEQKMYGVDIDGLFSNFVLISQDNVYPIKLESFKEIAFFEPVLAISAVLKAGMWLNAKILIYGDNRIAKLTEMILSLGGYTDVTCKIPESYETKYDYVIETVPTSDGLNSALNCIKPGGSLVLKSRIFHIVNLDMFYLLRNNIKVVPAYYNSDIASVINLMEGALSLKDLVGSDYDLSEYPAVFDQSLQRETLKSYLRLG